MEKERKEKIFVERVGKGMDRERGKRKRCDEIERKESDVW